MNKWRSLKSAHVKKILSFTLALGLCIGAVTVFPLLSKAADKVDLTSACSITAYAISTNTDDAIKEDIAKADVVIDYYKIADAIEHKKADGYTFDVVSPYYGIVDLPEGTKAEEWMGVAQKAASVVMANYKAGTPLTPTAYASSGKTADSLEAGLYLVIARGATQQDYFIEKDNTSTGGKDIVTMATGEDNEYFFAPEIVAVPTKDPNAAGEIDLSAPTDWKYSSTIYMKPYWEPRFGDLKIIKDLLVYEDSEPAYFIFEVVWEKKYGDTVKKKTDYHTLEFTEAGEKYLLIENVPVGADVTVTEINSGVGYTIQGSKVQNSTILANDFVEVRFTNTWSTGGKGGAITNHFAPRLNEDGTIKYDDNMQPEFDWFVLKDSTEEVAN